MGFNLNFEQMPDDDCKCIIALVMNADFRKELANATDMNQMLKDAGLNISEKLLNKLTEYHENTPGGLVEGIESTAIQDIMKQPFMLKRW